MKSLRSHYTVSILLPRNFAILHRALVAVCAVTLVCAPLLLAQRSPQSAGPRASALLELAPNGRAQLVPVAIVVNGKWYDASIYRADPRPMALDPETVYEAEHSGASAGLFTITNTATFKDVWVGVGQWRSNAVLKAAKQAASGKKQAAIPTAEADFFRRPTLKRSPDEGETPTAPAESPTSAPAKPASAAVTQAAPAADSSDSSSDGFERPILRRGKPAEKQLEDEVAPVTLEKPGAEHVAGSANHAAKTPDTVQVLTAISDAGGPRPRSCLVTPSAADRQMFQDKVGAMAYQAVLKFAGTHTLHKPGPAAALNQTTLQVFDLHYNNEPVIVLSATLPATYGRGTSPGMPPNGPAAFQYYVTVVAQRDLYGNLHQLFARVTDSAHLDVDPRMDLIDAVDAEGTGNAQLLFREIGDTGYRYALYRAGMYKLSQFFVSTTRSF